MHTTMRSRIRPKGAGGKQAAAPGARGWRPENAGLPADNAAGYRIGSAINVAEGLKGRLLVVHGSGDDNVLYQLIARYFIEHLRPG
jgi:dipeptidyl aminopeptidase/acylaminoacyl peptidase